MTQAPKTQAPSAFKIAMRRLAATVNVITTEAGGRRYGVAATAVTSLSTDPESVLVCLNKSSSITPVILERKLFCVNILAGHHTDLSHAFGGGLAGEDRFGMGDWERSQTGVPYLADAQANLFCEIDNAVAYGTHQVLFSRILDIRLTDQNRPLIYGDGRYHQVG